jgi:hypothetical protein
MKFTHLLLAAIPLLLAIALGACSNDDSVSPPPAGDRIPPEVIATLPTPGAGGADLHEPLTVFFSEPMDSASATGNVALAGGTITELSWESPRELSVVHESFAEGDTVTLTVGAALTDVAGNGLAAPYAVSFRTTSSSELVIMGISPADGAVDVPLNAGITLRFSEWVELAQVESGVVLSDASGKTDFAFTVRDIRYNTFLLTPESDLPAGTRIYLRVSDELTASWGQTLAASWSASFTTGTDEDVAMPEIVAVEPASGAADVSQDQGFIRLTFSEPILHIGLVRKNLAWWALVEQSSGYVGEWNVERTQLTVSLPSGLPAGTPFDLTYDFIEDFNGVVRPQPYHYEIRVAGEPDYLPYAGGERFLDLTEWESGSIGSTEVTDDGWGRRWIRIDYQDADSWREAVYFNPNPEGDPYALPTGEWEAYRKTSTALLWLGWQAVEPEPAKSYEFDTPLTVLPLPLAEGTWSAGSTVTGSVEGDQQMDLAGRLLPQQDYPLPGYGSVFIKDAWIAVLDREVERDGTLAVTGQDSIFYAPVLGPVRQTSYESDLVGGTWRREVTWRQPYPGFQPYKEHGFPYADRDIR